MPASIDLTSKVAVITGVLGRLGAVWTDAMLGAGATVVGLDVHMDIGPALTGVLSRHGEQQFELIKADVTDRAALRDAHATCLSEVGLPSILVNNAGVDEPPSTDRASWWFGDLPDEPSRKVLDVNALGTLRVCQVFGSDMARRRSGSVINIGSLYGGVAPNPELYDHLPIDPPFLKPPAYGMSKAGVAALTRYLAALWGPTGLRVNTLSPGGVLGGQDQQFRAKFDARVPLRRMASTDDLIGPLLFLASDLSSYVTGAELVVDGGYTCW